MSLTIGNRLCLLSSIAVYLVAIGAISLSSPFSKRGLSDLIDSQGYEHINNVFPHAEDFSIAISREWSVRTLLHSQKSEATLPYLTCVPQHALAHTQQILLEELQLEHYPAFVSASRNRACLVVYATLAQTESLYSKSPHIEEDAIVPLPKQLKWDTSIAATTHWLVQNRKNGKNSSAHKINGDEVEACPLFTRVGTHGALLGEQLQQTAEPATQPQLEAITETVPTASCHPILNALSEQREMELSVVLRKDIGFLEMHSELDHWLAALGWADADSHKQNYNAQPEPLRFTDEHSLTISQQHQQRQHGNEDKGRLTHPTLEHHTTVKVYPTYQDRAGFYDRFATSNKEKENSGHEHSSSNIRFSKTRNFRLAAQGANHRTANARLATVPHYANYDLQSENFAELLAASEGTTKVSRRTMNDVFEMMTAFHLTQERRRRRLSDMWSTVQSMVEETQQSIEASSRTVCEWNKLIDSIQFRKRTINLRLNSDWLRSTTEDINSNAAGCFALMAATISSSHQVVRLATSLPVRLGNDFARATTQSGGYTGTFTQDCPFSAAGLNGTGEVIGISDSGVDEYHCFFYDPVHGFLPRNSRATFKENPYFDLSRRKLVQYVAYTSSGSKGDWANGHGTHTSGTLVGACIDTHASQVQYNGVAMGAKLAFFDIGQRSEGQLDVPWDISLIFQSAFTAGSRVHSNSWGGGYWYDSYCLEVDDFLNNHDDFAVVFAAGNDGSTGYQSILSPGLSKNAVAASSSQSHPVRNVISAFASVGPAPDGRIKPDVVAPGEPIYSALAVKEGQPAATARSCGTTAKMGTSMATPAVGGNMALIRQFFKDHRFWASLCDPSYPRCHRGNFPPKGCLVKAILMHSGISMDLYNGVYSDVGKRPLITLPDSSFQGYGRVTLKNVFPSLPAAQSPFSLFVDQVNMTDFTELNYEVSVSSSAVMFKATIAWYDPSNEVFAARVLLNDIDLVVTDPDGKVFYGNADGRSGTPAPESKRDEVNNAELVAITSPKVGVWKVSVQAKLLSGSPVQLVAVVITANGAVSGHGLQGIPAHFNPGNLDPCPTAGAQFVEVSKWARGSGLHYGTWSEGTQYSIAKEDGTIIKQGSSRLPYQNDNICLLEGCYHLDLQFSTSQRLPGVQASIAACDIRVAGLVPSQWFCLTAPTPSNFSSYLYEPEVSCTSMCHQSDHYTLRVEMFEGGGVGWEGAYYALHQLDIPGVPNPDISYAAIGAGTMEWGFGEYRDICIPSGDSCYVMELSIPESDDGLDPLFVFRDAKTYNADGSLSNTECPYVLHHNVTFAKLCVHDQKRELEVTFLGQALPLTNFGQVATDWTTLMTKYREQVAIGTCGSPLLYDASSAPSMSPTRRPTHHSLRPSAAPVAPVPSASPTRRTRNPTMDSSFTSMPFTKTFKPSNEPVPPKTSKPSRSPTTKPTHHPIHSHAPSTVAATNQPHTATRRPTVEGQVPPVDAISSYNYSCLASCSPDDYDPTMFTEKSRLAVCNYLIYIFKTCGTYSLSEGSCEIPACASSCDAETWCYYGTGASLFCPTDSWNAPSSVPLQLSMQRQCLSKLGSMALKRQVDKYALDHSPKPAASSETVEPGLITAAVALGLAFTGICIFGAMRMIQKSKDPVSDFSQLSTVSDDSSHGSPSYAVVMNDSSKRGRGSIELSQIHSPIPH